MSARADFHRFSNTELNGRERQPTKRPSAKKKNDFQSPVVAPFINQRVAWSSNLSIPQCAGRKKRTIAFRFARHFHDGVCRSVSTANSSTLHHGTAYRNEITTAVNDIRYGRWDRTNLITSRSRRSSFHLPVSSVFSLSRSMDAASDRG